MPDSPVFIKIEEAAQALKAGELVAIPTETVYGLAADAMNPQAVKKIFALKGRPADHPLIVHIASSENLSVWAKDIPDVAYRLADAFWPGPLTFILPKRDEIPDIVTGGQHTVGLRSPNNPLTLALLKHFDGGLAAPSANRFGRISPTAAQHVQDEFGVDAPKILDGGPCQIGIESTIVDLSQSPARILRPGQISFEQLLPFLPELVYGAQKTSPRVSGDMEAHYAPRTPLYMLDRSQLISQAGNKSSVVLCFDYLPDNLSGLVMQKNADIYAQQLYANLRTLDNFQAEQILIEQIPVSNDWLAINDRIKRAIIGSSPN
ncbi:MAG TPA: L-threonylcarbamoyladenylate synthase [Arenimonas sp.]|nr:L-threonylcarbamoyladenylate synthase [Arenimonas sp.]